MATREELISMKLNEFRDFVVLKGMTLAAILLMFKMGSILM